MPIEPAPFGSPYSSDPPRDPDAIVLRDHLATLFAARNFILAAMVAGGLAAGIFALTRPTTYNAAALLLVDEQHGAISDPSAMREIIDSYSFQATIEQKLGPHAEDGFDLKIESIPSTRLLRLHVKSSTRETAQQAANIAATELIDLDRRLSQSDATSVRDLVEKQLWAAQGRARELGEQLEKFPQIEILSGGGGKTEGSGIVDLLVDLEGEKARLAAAQSQLNRTPKVLQGQGVRKEATALVEHAARGEQQAQAVPPSTAGTPNTATSLQIDGPFLFNDTTNPVYTVLEYQASVSRNRVAQLERQRDALIRLLNLSGSDVVQLRQLYAKRLELKRLQTEYDLAQRIYVDLRARWEQARIDAAARPTRLQILDTARQPTHSAPRNVALTIALGLFVSGVLASAFALVRQSLRRTRRLPGAPVKSNVRV